MLQRIGELLVANGDLTPSDLQAILTSQKKSYQPFGQIAAALYNVRPEAIWRAWGSQYARFCPVIRLLDERCDPALAGLLTGAQAWEHHLLPLRYVDGDIVIITDRESLNQALRFVDERIPESAVIWLAGAGRELREMLERTYGPCPQALNQPSPGDRVSTDRRGKTISSSIAGDATVEFHSRNRPGNKDGPKGQSSAA